jgi:predicted SAM-dependent methyltransferase
MTTMTRLHLGCGKRVIDAFFNVDALDYPHVNHRGPVDDLSFVADETVELVYACHVLEHFGRNDISRVLAEWRRVLKPGGILRLAVPDFPAWAELYLQGKLNSLRDLMGAMVGGQRDEYDYHKMIFDEATLRELLIGVGFREVRRWDWREVDHGKVDDYSQSYIPHMDKEKGRLVSLNVEAVR